MRCIIIYQKSDGSKFIRAYNYDYGRKIGDETTMGWKVINVLYEYEGNYYQHNKYMRIICEKVRNQADKGKIRKTIKKIALRKLELRVRKLEQNLYR